MVSQLNGQADVLAAVLPEVLGAVLLAVLAVLAVGVLAVIASLPVRVSRYDVSGGASAMSSRLSGGFSACQRV